MSDGCRVQHLFIMLSVRSGSSGGDFDKNNYSVFEKFPLPGVIIRKTEAPGIVKKSVFKCENFQVNQQEFGLNIEGVGRFYARDGKEVEFAPTPGADPDWVDIYLNGQVLAALLHQRRIINFHASSFIYDGRGVMILGETGAGKSSLTVSFALAGAGFLTDDLTPVIFKRSGPYIWPLYRDIKLRENTVTQLDISREKLREAEKGTGKQYLEVNRANVRDHPLHTVLKIEIGDSHKVEFHEPTPVEKFSLLRSEICSWELLAGMPETEAEYLQQLLHIVRQVKFVRVVRPADIEISALHTAVRNYLAEAEVKK
jgi:hypothetical protein